MRKLAFLVVGGAVWLLLGAVPASADNGPHQSTAGTVTDRCAGCHRLHTGQAPFVLVEEEPALCYTCHGAGTAGASTDVQMGLGFGNVYPSTARGAAVGALRGGGFEYALIDSNSPTFAITDEASRITTTPGKIPVLGSPVPSTSAHSVDESAQTAWGGGTFSASPNYGTASVKLTCTSCHDPHGGANAAVNPSAPATYRILKVNPAGLGVLTPTCLLSSAVAGGTCTVTVTAETTPGTGEKVTCTVAGSPPFTTCTSNSVSPPTGSASVTPVYPSCTIPTVSTASVCKPGSLLVVSDIPAGAGNQSYTSSDYWQDLADPGIARATTGLRNASPYYAFTQSVAFWCSACHTRYRATSGKTYAYNTGDAVTTYRHRGDSQSGPYGDADHTANALAVTGVYKASPNCIQCHVSHGSNSATGSISGALKNPDGLTVGLGVGGSASVDNRLLRIDQRGVCEQCHKK